MVLFKLNTKEDIYTGKNILITGGTGSFGNKIVETLFKEFKPNKIIIFSRDEYKQYLMRQKFPEDSYKIRYFIGDIRDFERLKLAFKNIDIIFHAAALKHVPSIEYNPMEAIKTNIYGTDNVIKAAIENNVDRVIGISTDKCVSPANLYGSTKLCLEKIVIAGNIMSGNKTKCSVLRYGNVFASRGSVVPLFLKQKKEGLIKVTDSRMTRFTLTLDDAINFVLNSANSMVGGEIFVPKLPSYNILQLANVIGNNVEIKEIGIRPGEKIHESMIGDYESHLAIDCGSYYVIQPNISINDNNNIFYNKYGKNILGNNKNYNSNDNERIEDEELYEILLQYILSEKLVVSIKKPKKKKKKRSNKTENSIIQ